MAVDSTQEGEGTMGRMAEVTKRFRFEAAHQLPYHVGKCRHVHGHNYEVEVCVRGLVQGEEVGSSEGMVVDFIDLSALLKPLFARMDHSFLAAGDEEILDELKVTGNKVYDLGVRTTAENLAWHIFDVLDAPGALSHGWCEWVRVWETPDSSAICRRPDEAAMTTMACPPMAP